MSRREYRIHAVSALQMGISDFLTDDQDYEKIQELNRISLMIGKNHEVCNSFIVLFTD